jgi:hypothetical protein
MDHFALGGAGPQKNPFGSYEAYGCLEPRYQQAARKGRLSRMLCLVTYALIGASFLSSPAHAALISAAY